MAVLPLISANMTSNSRPLLSVISFAPSTTLELDGAAAVRDGGLADTQHAAAVKQDAFMLHHDLRLVLQRHVGTVRAVIEQDELVAPPIDARMIARSFRASNR